MRRGRAAALAVLVVVLSASCAVPFTSPPTSTATCDLFASTSGSDANPGSAQAPFRTVSTLVSRLTAGRTGCLLGGRFAEDVAFYESGQPGSPITLASAPGYRATIVGIVWVSDSANDVVISDLNLDGTNGGAAPNPQINGDRVTLRANDITNNHSGICVILGGSFLRGGRADGAVIEGNRIHDCGRLPATNHDHGIYVEGSTGSRIVDNVFYGNADWGIHLYPDADNTYIARNIVDGNGKGLIFAGERANEEYAVSYASDNNVVENNIITNSTLGPNVQAWWGGAVGSGNVVRRNCLWTPSGTAGLDLSGGGFTATANVVADPLFVDAANHDYRLRSDSPCADMAPTDPLPT